MELVLAGGLAVAVVWASSVWVALLRERDRARALSAELSAARRATALGSLGVAGEGAATGALSAEREAGEAAAWDGAVEEPRASISDGASDAIEAAADGISGAEASAARPLQDLDRSRLREEEPPRQLAQPEELVEALAGLRADLAIASRASAAADGHSSWARAAKAGRASESSSMWAREPEALALTADRLVDLSARLKEELSVEVLATARLTEEVRSVGPLLLAIEARAESLKTLTASLSGLADRINLLALNVALLAARDTAAGAAFESSGVEMRGLFEEARQLSREMGSVVQKLGDTAHRVLEIHADAVRTGDGGREKGERATREMLGLEAQAARLVEEIAEAGRETRIPAALDSAREEALRAWGAVERLEGELLERREAAARALLAIDGVLARFS